MNINIDEKIYFLKEAIKSMERGVTPFSFERVSRQIQIKKDYEQLLEWLEELKKLRKERNNNGWILCSERLPSQEERLKSYCRNIYGSSFIVMIREATIPTTLYIKMNEDIWFDEERNCYNVIAW